jgi:DNA replication protein DnaC
MEELQLKHKKLEEENKLAQIQKIEEVKKANDEVLKILAKNRESRMEKNKQTAEFKFVNDESMIQRSQD